MHESAYLANRIVTMNRSASWIMRIPATIVTMAIRFYQRFISPMTPPSCRFQPTCSQYALTSIERYGLIKGGWMGLKRVGRCHPWNPGGHDPVP